MKKIIATALLILVNLHTINAQEWQTDISVAIKIATANNKPVILVFQGSDWCAPCIKLDRQVWSTGVFKKYAKENYVLLQADFPKRKKNALSKSQADKNAKLAEKYNKNGIFPFVVVLNANGKVIGESGYKKTTPENYIKELNAFIK